jgi:hypothetical protein
MIEALLLIALSQLPVELHCDGSRESRLLLRAITRDIPCIDEDTRAVAHYQECLRRIVVVKLSQDTFIRIGQHKHRLPMLAYDTPFYTVLAIKRLCDEHNRPRRIYAREVADAEFVKFAGLVDLGDEGNELAELPQPWQGMEMTIFRGPEIEK